MICRRSQFRIAVALTLLVLFGAQRYFSPGGHLQVDSGSAKLTVLLNRGVALDRDTWRGRHFWQSQAGKQQPDPITAHYLLNESVAPAESRLLSFPEASAQFHAPVLDISTRSPPYILITLSII